MYSVLRTIGFVVFYRIVRLSFVSPGQSSTCNTWIYATFPTCYSEASASTLGYIGKACTLATLIEAQEMSTIREFAPGRLSTSAPYHEVVSVPCWDSFVFVGVLERF